MAFINRCLQELLSCHALIMRHVIGAVHPRHASKLSYGAIYRLLCNPSNKVSSIGRKRFNPAHHFHPSRLHSSLVFSHADFPLVYFVSKRSERWIESRRTLRICWKLEETSQVFLGKLLTRKHWQIAVWLLRPRAKCIYVLENMLRDEYGCFDG